jgi:hypothetical protein
MQNAGRHLALALALPLCLPTAACGTLLYPDRVDLDRTGRDLDVAVFVMDGVLLLLGVVPGIVAFAVDAATGAIYLPPGASSPQEPTVVD